MLGNGVIALEDSLTLLPWHLSVNLGTEDTSAVNTLALSPEGRAKSIGEML